MIRSISASLLLALALVVAPGRAAEFSTEAPGETFVSLPAPLAPIAEGKSPTSLDQLRLLEQQHRQIAQRAAACTVGVQIGVSQGCGVIITPDGYVLTAAHVAMRPQMRAMLTLADGRTVQATTLGMNREVDAGLIKIDEGQNEGQPWPHASLGSSEDLRAGMWALATGHPGGYDPRRGPVTRVGRILAKRTNSLVTDCALIGGDSGGPLFDLSGRLIGIHSRIGNEVTDNLHVPIDHYDESWQRLAAGEAWGFLPGFRPHLGVQGVQGGNEEEAIVQSVTPRSAAAAAGIQAGDVIERFNRRDIESFNDLKEAVAETMPGERVSVVVRRDGKRVPMRIEIGRDPRY